MPRRDKFDDEMVDIDTAILNLQVAITGFVLKLLEKFENMRSDVNLSIAVHDREGFRVLAVKSVYYDSESESIFLDAEDGGELLNWRSLDISAQHYASQELLRLYTANRLFDDLQDNGMH